MKDPAKADGRLSKAEIEYLLRALKAQLKAAKTSILGMEPKLRAEFEEQLNRSYPLQHDPVWLEAFDALLEQYKASQAKVEARSVELGIPTRFRPSIQSPAWIGAGLNMLKEFRAEMRRVAYAEIKVMLTERMEELRTRIS
jgi:hypothetical protein